jgi:hypothetical protein
MITVYRIVKPRILAEKYQRLGGTSYLHLLFPALKLETTDSLEALVDFCQTTRHRIPEVHRLRASNIKYITLVFIIM